LANTSVARTPEPAATVYGPLRSSQPPSVAGSVPENVCVVGAAWAVACSSAPWCTRLSRTKIAPLRPSTNVRYAGGSAPSVSSTIVSYAGMKPRSTVGHATALVRWTSETPASLNAL